MATRRAVGDVSSLSLPNTIALAEDFRAEIRAILLYDGGSLSFALYHFEQLM